MLETITVLIAILAVGVSFATFWRYEKYTKALSSELQDIAHDTTKAFMEELEPLRKSVSRAMGMKSELAVDARQLKTAEKYIAEDVMQSQDPLIIAGLELLSPRTKEYLDENPHLLMQLIPRLQALQETGDVLGFLKPGGPAKLGNRSRMREE